MAPSPCSVVGGQSATSMDVLMDCWFFFVFSRLVLIRDSSIGRQGVVKSRHKVQPRTRLPQHGYLETSSHLGSLLLKNLEKKEEKTRCSVYIRFLSHLFWPSLLCPLLVHILRCMTGFRRTARGHTSNNTKQKLTWPERV